MNSAVRRWRLLAFASRAGLVVVLETFVSILCAMVFARSALGYTLYQTFLTEIPRSRIGRELGYLVNYVIGIPGLNTSGRSGDDWTLVLKDYYPPVVLPCVLLGLIVGLVAISIVARHQVRGGIESSVPSRWVWMWGFVLGSVGPSSVAAWLWERTWIRGLW